MTKESNETNICFCVVFRGIRNRSNHDDALTLFCFAQMYL